MPVYRYARGRVQKRNGTWYYVVRDLAGRVILEDNANNYLLIQNSCRMDVYAVDRMIIAGHMIEFSYPEIVRHRLDNYANIPKYRKQVKTPKIQTNIFNF